MRVLLTLPPGHAREQIVELLEHRGHEVTVRETADHAAAAQQQTVHGLVLAAEEPEGLALCRRVRQRDGLGETRVLLLGEGGEVQARRAAAAGAEDYLPPDPERLKIWLAFAEQRNLESSERQPVSLDPSGSQPDPVESRLVLTDRMASVGTLAAGVAHELNNPLAYVVSNLRLLRDRLGELERPDSQEDPTSLQELVDDSLHGVERLGRIVRDLNTFSSVGDDFDDVVDVRAVLEASLNVCGNEIRHRAKLVTQIHRLPRAKINEGRLGQVFLNLLTNAAQAIPEGQADRHRITVMAHRDNDGRACIQVEDTGPGVEERLLDRIFDPFFTTKEPGRGTGLGLSIVRNIVAQAGGELSFDSAPGQGTTVRVWLPPAPESDRPNRTTQSLRPLGREAPSYRILVVDDDTMVARALTRTLRGHDVTVAHSGQQALQKLVAEDYDVVLCDLMMPETSGMDLYEWSRAQRPALADRFVFMTGGAFTPRARRFVHEHSVGTLEKPFDPRHVRELVHSRAEKARSS